MEEIQSELCRHYFSKERIEAINNFLKNAKGKMDKDSTTKGSVAAIFQNSFDIKKGAKDERLEPLTVDVQVINQDQIKSSRTSVVGPTNQNFN